VYHPQIKSYKKTYSTTYGSLTLRPKIAMLLLQFLEEETMRTFFKFLFSVPQGAFIGYMIGRGVDIAVSAGNSDFSTLSPAILVCVALGATFMSHAEWRNMKNPRREP
jgi:hypothetical protein